MTNESRERVLAKCGGDERVFKLLEIAKTAYRYLPDGMLNLKTGEPTRNAILSAVAAFGFRVERFPWERFPTRFHSNRPDFELFESDTTDADVEQYWSDLIAAQEPGEAKVKRAKGKKR